MHCYTCDKSHRRRCIAATHTPYQRAASHVDNAGQTIGFTMASGPQGRAAEACVVFCTDPAVPPREGIEAALQRRQWRATTRAWGLRALAALARATTVDVGHYCYLPHVRPALRGDEHHTDSTTYHYFKHLTGCSAAVLDRVQGGFILLFTRVTDLLDTAAARSDPVLMHMLAWTAALDYEARDHELFLRVGLVPLLQRLVSLSNLKAAQAAQFVRVNGGAAIPARALVPMPNTKWSADTVKQGIISGRISVAELLLQVLVRDNRCAANNTTVTAVCSISFISQSAPATKKMLKWWSSWSLQPGTWQSVSDVMTPDVAALM